MKFTELIPETRWMNEIKSWMKLEKYQKYTHLLSCFLIRSFI